MNKVELSRHLEANYPANKSSITRRRPLFGIGINDASYTTTPMVDGVRLCDPAYRAWVDMMRRAYDHKFHEKQPTYLDVTVCKDWHSFSSFRVWWLNSCREGFSLDKDLLVIGNRQYAPDTCICIPSWLNNLTIDHGASRGELPIGVCLDRRSGKYQSSCSNHITGKRHKLGRFTTPEEAYEAWLTYKLQLADQLKPAMDAIDQRIYPNVVTIIKALI